MSHRDTSRINIHVSMTVDKSVPLDPSSLQAPSSSKIEDHADGLIPQEQRSNDHAFSVPDTLPKSHEAGQDHEGLQFPNICAATREVGLSTESSLARVRVCALSRLESSPPICSYTLYREELVAAMNEGQTQLQVLQRQAILSNLYPSARSVMES